jgi:hypothetical protein
MFYFRATFCFGILAIAAAAQTSPELAFTDKYKSAHERRDVAALKQMHWLEHISPDDQTISDPRFYNFDEPIKRIQIIPAATWPLPTSGCDPSTFYLRMERMGSGLHFRHLTLA